MKRFISGLLFLLCTTPVYAENVLYCEAKLATGIAKEKGRWITSSFKKDRYTIKFNDDYTKLEGIDDRPMDCVAPFPSLKEPVVSCINRERYHLFTYNWETKRFSYVFMPSSSYVDNGNDTQSTESGVCKKF